VRGGCTSKLGARTGQASGSCSDLVIQLLVQPGARRDEVVGRHGEALKVRVRAPAQQGRANRAALALLAAALGVPEQQVTLVGGAASRSKWVRVLGADTGALRRLLSETRGRSPPSSRGASGRPAPAPMPVCLLRCGRGRGDR